LRSRLRQSDISELETYNFFGSSSESSTPGGVLRELSSCGYETAPGLHYSGFLAIIDDPTRVLGMCGAHPVESLNR